VHQVRLPGPLHLIVSDTVETRLHRKAQDRPSLPAGIDQVLAELDGRAGGVPAVIDSPLRNDGDPSLLVHGSTWVMRLFPTREFRGARRGYRIASVDPLRIRDHHRLAQGYLLVFAQGWRRLYDVRQLPDTALAYWPQLVAEHQRLVRDLATTHAGGATAELSPAHAAFLDRMDGVIDANERITTDSARTEKPYVYRAVEPVGERRHGTHPVYRFVIEGDRLPADRVFVQVRGESDQRGQVTRVADRSVTVRFDQPVDWKRLPPTGELEATTSHVVFQQQREATSLLRDGLARNGSLLSVLVEHRVRPARQRPATPTTSLDPGQHEAFARALGVEDLMVVLGPPGTGKTRVISQITRATAVGTAGRPPARVLVTSHTNRAVDNVLGRLPADLVVVRVGNDGTVTDEGRPYLLETQAGELRDRILRTVGAALRDPDALDIAQRWADELANRTDALDECLRREAAAGARWLDERRAAGGPAQAEVDSLAADGRRQRHSIDRLLRKAGRNDALARRLRWFAGWFAKRTATLTARVDELRAGLSATAAELVAAEQRLDRATEQAPAVRAARGDLDAAATTAADALADALAAADAARAAAGGPEPAPTVPDDGTPADSYAALRVLCAWLADQLPLLRRRNRLLAEWHHEVSGATSQLHPELIRYADVIAATCVGTGSRPELSKVEFDLAIVDEAGQIGTADVLVPLVRAKRAVLVGDPRQLPPYLDSEVADWGREIDDPRVRDLLSHSALELLVDQLPRTNVVPLTEQRRMPQVVADFISAQFYGGMLTTRVDRHHRDDLFRSAFAFVDTARLPAGRRHERPAQGPDRGRHGYHNPAEARLLAALAAHYDSRGQDWAVIVPYRAQVKAVADLLVGLIGQPDKVRLNVGSVDSFQGGERDVILYGFTRSNADGRIGFLKEPRRANVAFTRAKQQLVLVGDLGTLTTARDQEFRKLAAALRDHVAARGDLRQYDDIMGRLDTP
jgi:ATP-dependent RNA/DNA helicase IGHMBP2